jgi:hypothetical protein
MAGAAARLAAVEIPHGTTHMVVHDTQLGLYGMVVQTRICVTEQPNFPDTSHHSGYRIVLLLQTLLRAVEVAGGHERADEPTPTSY